MVSEQRFSRETSKTWLAEAPHAGGDVAMDDGDRSGLLDRLERQAAESGRLEGRVETLERALKTERDARRRLAATLKRERKAAEALHIRAKEAEAATAARAAELEQLRQAAAVAEQQKRAIWMQLSEAERQLAEQRPPLWRRLLRR